MSPDAASPGGATPRKTLDEIRREIEEEFSPRQTADAQAPPAPRELPKRQPRERLVARSVPRRSLDDDDDDQAALLELEAGDSARRPMPRRVGYILAGLIGCLVGQLAILGYFVAVHYRSTSGVVGMVATPLPSATSRSQAPAPSSPPASTVTSETDAAPDTARSPDSPDSITEPPRSRDPVAAPAPGMAVAEPPAPPSLPSTTTVPPVTSVPSPTSVPPVTTPAPAVSDPKPVTRPLARQPRSAPRSPVVGSAARIDPPARGMAPQDWGKSQEEVRAALREWLAVSGRGADSVTSDIVVILGSDGRTARTHVPMRLGGGVVIREQRWERGPSGWRIVAER
jgi:hypothetical protein